MAAPDQVLAPPAPPYAAAVFGPALPQAEHYAALLADVGVAHGVIGPREVPRLWERHLVNCALIAPLVEGPEVLDLGSGAGLPGLVLALLRPELSLVLVDATRRRTVFLTGAIEVLGLTNVAVRWARAEELAGQAQVATVTARAVAPLDRLLPWAMPLVRPGGQVLAMKGANAAAELAAARATVERVGGTPAELLTVGADVAPDAATVVRTRRRPSGRARAR